ncbi:MAG: histidine triad protein [Gemmatimonadetes bacterium]|nr:histidine triad protein [Gemmatimonadota bacterium]
MLAFGAHRSYSEPRQDQPVPTFDPQTLRMRSIVIASAVLLISSALGAQQLPRAIDTDPPHDTLHPARLEVLHIPSGGVKIVGMAYVPAGAGVHPTLVIFHGLPGMEKNLDLAQAVRRAGWNAITVNYRGSWGSPGVFRFGNNLEDAAAVLAFLRDSATIRSLAVDTSRLVVAGHSMGGWVAALTAAHDHAVRGAVLISMADMGRVGTISRSEATQLSAANMESLAGVTPESMADDLLGGAARWRVGDRAEALARTPLLVLTSNDGLAPHSDALVKLVRARGNERVTTVHAPTDHSWSDKRVMLESEVIRWLQQLDGRRSAR